MREREFFLYISPTNPQKSTLTLKLCQTHRGRYDALQLIHRAGVVRHTLLMQVRHGVVGRPIGIPCCFHLLCSV
jgi:hypothetical protein